MYSPSQAYFEPGYNERASIETSPEFQNIYRQLYETTVKSVGREIRLCYFVV